ncbi:MULTISPECIES: hypothetical protein [Streptomyces]|uniref:hypothetical protein n=1 Tax=Streptomyces TaxID=1883 RepID=UPI00339EC647
MEERKSKNDSELSESSAEQPAVPEAGYPESVHAAVNVAAPLLAAGAITITGVVAADEEKFRWPGVAVLLLILAVSSLLASIQLGFRARRYHFSKEELGRWFAGTTTADYWNDDDNSGWAVGTARNTWRILVRPAVHTYNLGTVLLGLGLSAALLPTSTSEQPNLRWTAAALTLAATVGELVWGWRLTMIRMAPPVPPHEGSPSVLELTKRPGDGSGSGSSIDGSDQRDA